MIKLKTAHSETPGSAQTTNPEFVPPHGALLGYEHMTVSASPVRISESYSSKCLIAE